MQNGSKYVPPHLRSSQGSGGNNGGNAEGGGGGGHGGGGGRGGHRGGRGGYRGGGGGRGYNNDRNAGSYNNSYNGGGGRGNNDYGTTAPANTDAGAQPPSGGNSRWNNVDATGEGGGGYNGGGRGAPGGGGGGGYRDGMNSGPRRNERGFHGDMVADKRTEARLFSQEDKQITGINFDNYDKIPIEVSGDNLPQPIDNYSVDTIGEDLYRNTQLCGYSKPTPVQKYSVPIGQQGRDLMACAQTGSGKTAGFLFPIIMAMLKVGGREPPPSTGRRRVYPETLVLAPTRELAQQIFEEAKRFCYCTGIASVCIYGGADVRDQIRQMDRGCDLLVATPGRLVDLIERGRLGMENVHFLVLDEADRMLDMGFEPQIRRIVEESGMPPSGERQTMMFSATFPTNIQRLASDFLRDYVYLTVGRVGSASKDVSQTVEYMEDHDKMEALMRFLLTIENGLILIFVETKRNCDYVEEILCSRGFPACSIHGDKSQREREESLRSFRKGDNPVMVATDVASRGLDIPNVTNVINYDLPTNIDDYVHRIGRTGRAGNEGAALSFLNEKNAGIARDLRGLLAENDQTIPPWLDQMCQFTGRSSGRPGRGGGGGRRGGGNSFGSRDYRYQQPEAGGPAGGPAGGGRGGRDQQGGGYGGGGYAGGGGGYGYGGGYGGGGGYAGGGGGNFATGNW